VSNRNDYCKKQIIIFFSKSVGSFEIWITFAVRFAQKMKRPQTPKGAYESGQETKKPQSTNRELFIENTRSLENKCTVKCKSYCPLRVRGFQASIFENT
jgi:hypothetical protein